MREQPDQAMYYSYVWRFVAIPFCRYTMREVILD